MPSAARQRGRPDMKFLTPTARAALATIKVLILDVDGVLTDGQIIYNDDGSETKVFNVRDGLGLRLLQHAGIEVAIATGRRTPALQHRCQNLGVKLIFDGLRYKTPVIEHLTKATGATPDEMLFMGDDLADLSLMAKVGLAVAVANAHREVITAADIVTEAKGGHGAVREVCEAILKAKGVWETMLADLRHERL